jgi:hypothetical protein
MEIGSRLNVEKITGEEFMEALRWARSQTGLELDPAAVVQPLVRVVTQEEPAVGVVALVHGYQASSGEGEPVPELWIVPDVEATGMEGALRVGDAGVALRALSALLTAGDEELAEAVDAWRSRRGAHRVAAAGAAS